MPRKMISKSCPKCVQQLPVACKACPCGHNFFSARRAILTAQAEESSTDEGTTKRRRTERVKRGKPNYYDALEYEKQTKKQKRARGDTHRDQHRKDCVEGQHRLKKKKKKKTAVEKEHEEKDVSLSTISPENSLKCLVILAEINRKMGSTSWRP